MSFLAWDTETHLIRPGRPFGRLVCVSWARPDGTCGLFNAADGYEFVREALRRREVLVGHNHFYDLWALVHAGETRFGDKEIHALVWRAVEEGLIRDTQIRESLMDIARGQFRRKFHPDGFVEQRRYSLAEVAHRRTRHELVKDTWRLRYSELDGVPLDQWPPGARQYSILDSVATGEVYVSQAKEDGISLDAAVGDEIFQVKKWCFQSLMSAYGLRTKEDAVRGLEEHIRAQVESVNRTLISVGLSRFVGKKLTKNTKEAARRMVADCRAEGRPIPKTKTAREKAKKGILVGEEEGVCTDEDACNDSADPALHAWALHGKLNNVLTKDIPMFNRGILYPIHSRFDIAETGRTTSTDPNVHNLKQAVEGSCGCRWDDTSDPVQCQKCKGKKKFSLLGDYGIRECFVPRPGFIYAQADYPGLELKTLAQFCVTVFGRSHLAEAINSGIDVHLKLAGEILGVAYPVAVTMLAAGDSRIKAARNLAKVANFGLPGGLSDPAFVSWAHGAGFAITLRRAAELRAAWHRAWPETVRYFALMRKLAGPRGGNGATFTHLFTGRRRSRVSYTQLCNAWFQGLGSDATGEAGFRLSRAMYCERESPLFGCRMVNYVHDEFIIEAPEYRAAAAAWEMVRIMREGANVFLPNVPFTEIEPVLMREWSKDAKTVLDAQGNLIPWEKVKA